MNIKVIHGDAPDVCRIVFSNTGLGTIVYQQRGKRLYLESTGLCVATDVTDSASAESIAVGHLKRVAYALYKEAAAH